MTPQHWQQVKQIFQSVVECSPGERAAFLDEACASDPSLRREVESLIFSHDQAGDSIEAMAGGLAAQILEDDQRGSFIGKNIGPYRIISHIGKGGMGDVFLAEDLRLERRVALKLLPREFAQDKDRLQRFQQEAHAASALNHPNILTIHEVGQIESLNFIVAEFIEGETLRTHMHGERLGVRDALGIAIQIASALAAAHHAGIVHRDVKPENIMLRDDGIVKVLDFGLAKLTHRAPSHIDTEAPTVASLITDPGTLMGTVNYMSPEQVRGHSVDVQTDLWSLGVVLYEMVAGRHPFEAATGSDVMASILQKEPPPLLQDSPGPPDELERIVRKALRKDREERYQTANEMFVDLRNLRKELEVEGELERSVRPASSRAMSSGPATTARQKSSAERIFTKIKQRKRGAAIALAVVLLAATPLALWLMQPKQLGAPVLTQLTVDTGMTIEPALSPDGKLLAYASDRSAKGNLDIWVRQIGGEPIRLTQGPGDEREPTFSPDGTMIAFWESSGIYVVSALGGPPRKIAPEGQRPRFSPDGSQIAYWSGWIGSGAGFSSRICRIFVVSSTGGAPRQVRPDFVGAAHPQWAPDGKHLLFLGNRDENLPADESIDWWVTPLDEGPPVATGALKATRKEGLTGLFLVYPWALVTPVWEMRDDWLIFPARSGDSNNLWRISISSKTCKVIGPPQRLTHSSSLEAMPSVASLADGSMKIAFVSGSENNDIWSLPIDAEAGKVTGELRQLTRDSVADFQPSLSPDRRKMVWVSARSGNQEIWIKDLETGEDAALTASRVPKYQPNFSPDGMKVSFSANRDNRWDAYLMPVTGGAAEMICEDCGQTTGWSPDGRYLIGNGLDGRVYLLEVASRRRIDLVAMSGRWFWAWGFSPDGRWITVGESGPDCFYIIPFHGETPAPESTWVPWGRMRDWSPDEALVYGDLYHDGFGCIGAQRLDQPTKRPVGPLLPIFHLHDTRRVIQGYSVGRKKMLIEIIDYTAVNIWMAQW